MLRPLRKKRNDTNILMFTNYTNKNGRITTNE